MRVEEVVGLRLREERERAGLSQSQLGQYVAPLLGRVWPRQAISHAEAGKRAFTAAELVAFAHVIGCDPGRLLTPPHNVDKVMLPSGQELQRSEIIRGADTPEKNDIRNHASRLVASGLAIQREGHDIEQRGRKIFDALDDGAIRSMSGINLPPGTR